MFGKTMPTRPLAPETLPQYLADGVPKQDDTDLRALQDWIDDLLSSTVRMSPLGTSTPVRMNRSKPSRNRAREPW